jgi:hypothetical protein
VVIFSCETVRAISLTMPVGAFFQQRIQRRGKLDKPVKALDRVEKDLRGELKRD